MDAGLSLPRLRHDLVLLPGGNNEQGEPSWLIHDPLSNRYFRIGARVFTLLCHWQAHVSPQKLMEETQRAGHSVTTESLMEVAGFLRQNGLSAVEDVPARENLLTQHQARQQHWAHWLMHHYLFFRIPLLRPDRFLTRSLPVVLPFFNRTLHAVFYALGLIGVLLTLRQWDQFQATFMHFFSWDGLLLYAITLGGVKCLHELGHAYTAKRYGCRVPSMGLAFLVLFPMPYTDVTDAWRLTDHKQRFSVSTAGIRVELTLALLATFLWSFLADGPLRSAVFFVATVSWIASLAINASPFMRFDGYYALMDWLGTDNLQQRAFALARWRLRELLFDLQEPPPESMTLSRRRLFITYAWATWIYRLVVFVGIALLVYYFAFKLLGILLFAVEIGWFILLPVQQELRAWWQRRGQIPQRPRARWSLFWLILLLLLLLLPWRQTVSLPAVVESQRFGAIYSPSAAIVTKVHVTRGEKVQAGDLLLSLESPDIKQEIRQVTRRIALLQQRIHRHGGSPEDLAQLAVLERELAAQKTSLHYGKAQDTRLNITAPFTGIIHDLAELRPGQWISRETRLAELLAVGAPRIEAWVEEAQLARISVGSQALFIARDGLQPSLQMKVVEIDAAAMVVLPYMALAQEYGGTIAVRHTAENELRPEKAFYRVTLQLLDSATPTPPMQLFGTVHVAAVSESLLHTFWRRLSAILVRESGF